mgnify:CR=1 FL=1
MRIAIIGQPNVGKSSLLNALIGEERTIVSDIAGTTRDPVHSIYRKFDKEFMLVDTAGIRKKSKVFDIIVLAGMVVNIILAVFLILYYFDFL